MIPEEQLKTVLQLIRLSQFIVSHPEDGQILEQEIPGTTEGIKEMLDGYISTLTEEERNQLLEAYAATAHLKPFES